MNNNLKITYLFFISCIFILININNFWGTSGDIALHYGLIYRIQQNLDLLKSYDPSLAVMSFYPPFGHALASFFGIVLKSTFLGMHIAILGSIAILWSSIYYILNKLPSNIFIPSFLILALFITINYLFKLLNIHGGEVIGNFFYSQIVGQSLIFFIIAVVVNASYCNNKKLIFIFLSIGLIILTCTHLLPAFQMLSIMVLLAFENVISKIINKPSRYKFIIFTLCLWIFLSIISILINPWYIMMKQVANHNGGLEMLNVSFPFGILFLAIICIILGCYIYIIALNKDLLISFKYFGLYSISTGILCLLQELAYLFFNIGSEYAVKKYIFAINTAIFLSLSCIFGYYFNKYFQESYFSYKLFFFKKLNYFFILILFLIMSQTLPSKSILRVSDVVSAEQKLILYKNSLIPKSDDGKEDIVIDLQNFPKAINWMFSMAIMKTPFEYSVNDAYLNSEIKDYGLYSTIVSGKPNRMLSLSGCGIYKSDISIYDGECISRFLLKSSSCKNNFDLSSKGLVDIKQLSGFSVAEVDGRWTDGDSAQFICYANGAKFSRITLELNPFIYPGHDEVKFNVTVNNIKKYEYSLSKNDINKPIYIDISNIKSDSKYVLDFQILNPISPKQAKISGDTRSLGVKVKTINFDN